MGYNTSFTGSFDIDPPLTREHRDILRELAETEHIPGEDGKPAREARSGRPCVYCQWRPTQDGTAIEWDGNEKFYGWLEWLDYITNRLLKPWGYTLNGEVRWLGEEFDDVGVIYVKDNRIEAVEFVNPGPSWNQKPA
ncbi:MAG TPA: hypothetical protein VH370_12860 [Humisphaera sp.]|jgi:hypothetical protein|nr:hypothetical protein [Humisphaera sp.]